MKDSNMKARISQLHKTEAQWAIMTDFVPLPGELIIFDPDEQNKNALLKIGDGSTPLRSLQFVIGTTADKFTTEIYNEVIDGGRITVYKK